VFHQGNSPRPTLPPPLVNSCNTKVYSVPERVTRSGPLAEWVTLGHRVG
jgi:hypothetical protein